MSESLNSVEWYPRNEFHTSRRQLWAQKHRKSLSPFSGHGFISLLDYVPIRCCFPPVLFFINLSRLLETWAMLWLALMEKYIWFVSRLRHDRIEHRNVTTVLFLVFPHWLSRLLWIIESTWRTLKLLVVPQRNACFVYIRAELHLVFVAASGPNSEMPMLQRLSWQWSFNAPTKHHW